MSQYLEKSNEALQMILQAINAGTARSVGRAAIQPGETFARPVTAQGSIESLLKQGLLERYPAQRQALAGLGPDITNVTATVVLEEVMGLVRPNYLMRRACRVVNMPQLVGTIRVATKMTAQQNVPAGVQPDLKQIVYGTPVTYDLADYKDVVAFILPDEDQKKANTNLMSDHTQDAAGAILAAENAKVAAVAEVGSVTLASAGAWATLTNNPYIDLMAARSVVKAAVGVPGNVVIADDVVWADFFGNPNVKFGQAPGGLVTLPSVDAPFPIPGAPGMIGIADTDISVHTAAIVVNDRMAFGLGDGPTEAEGFRDQLGGWDGYIIRHWNRTQALIAGGACRITGVKA
jgi:hypothetical protein